MATEKSILKLTRPAAADLSSSQYFATKLDGSAQLALATVAGERTLGPLQNAPTSGQHATAMLLGVSKVKLGGTADEHDLLTVDASSEYVKVTDPDEIPAAVCLQAGVDGDTVRAFVFGGVSPAGAAVTNALGALQYTKIAVSSAELLAINATPKTIVPAPGAGFAVQFHNAMLVLNYNSAAYANNGILGLYETNASGTQISGTLTLASFLAQTADTIKSIGPLESATAGITLAENKALVLTQATGESITGNSPVDVHCWYSVIATGL